MATNTENYCTAETFFDNLAEQYGYTLQHEGVHRLEWDPVCQEKAQQELAKLLADECIKAYDRGCEAMTDAVVTLITTKKEEVTSHAKANSCKCSSNSHPGPTAT